MSDSAVRVYTVDSSSAKELAIDSPLRPRPKTIEDITSSKAFVPVLDESAHKLADVFTDYTFKLETQCGLKSCRRPHKWGYWIVTVDGVETILGNKCGRKYFPEFAAKRDAYHERRDREDLVMRYQELQAVAGKIEAQIRDIMLHSPFGFDWVKKCRGALEQPMGGEKFRALGFHQRRGAIQVSIERELSQAEVDQAWELNGRRGSKEQFRIESRNVGVLGNAQWTYYDFRENLVKGLMDHVAKLRDSDPTKLSNTSIRRIVKPLAGWEAKLREAQAVCDQCKAFLSDDNLQLLGIWLRDEAARKRLHDWQLVTRDRLLGGNAPR